MQVLFCLFYNPPSQLTLLFEASCQWTCGHPNHGPTTTTMQWQHDDHEHGSNGDNNSNNGGNNNNNYKGGNNNNRNGSDDNTITTMTWLLRPQWAFSVSHADGLTKPYVWHVFSWVMFRWDNQECLDYCEGIVTTKWQSTASREVQASQCCHNKKSD